MTSTELELKGDKEDGLKQIPLKWLYNTTMASN
jgi:hypothetical protein